MLIHTAVKPMLDKELAEFDRFYSCLMFNDFFFFFTFLARFSEKKVELLLLPPFPGVVKLSLRSIFSETVKAMQVKLAIHIYCY
jgi:hypothetical protein